MVFDEVFLEPEEKELLVKLVEAARNVPRERRQKFSEVHGFFKGQFVRHTGLPGGSMPVDFEDIKILASVGLVKMEGIDPNMFYVTPRGFAYYNKVKLGNEPIQQVQTEVRSYLDAQSFKERYPHAYGKWADAETKLWASDSERQFTVIGHLCREAIQEFATALVERYQPPDIDQDKTHDVNRVRAVVDQHRKQLSEKVRKSLEALVLYWESVSGLVQRQEHGARKEGERLVWEDARRLVFQTAVVMFEIDRSLSSL